MTGLAAGLTMGPETTGASSRRRFGIEIGGLRLLIPADQAAEFVPQATVWPLPLAPRRLRGVTQLRGQPVTVFDASPRAPEHLPVKAERAIVVIDSARSAAAALLLEQPPRALDLEGEGRADALRPNTPLAPALLSERQAFDGESRASWWEADFDRLLPLLAAWD